MASLPTLRISKEINNLRLLRLRKQAEVGQQWGKLGAAGQP